MARTPTVIDDLIAHDGKGIKLDKYMTVGLFISKKYAGRLQILDENADHGTVTFHVLDKHGKTYRTEPWVTSRDGLSLDAFIDEYSESPADQRDLAARYGTSYVTFNDISLRRK